MRHLIGKGPERPTRFLNKDSQLDSARTMVFRIVVSLASFSYKSPYQLDYKRSSGYVKFQFAHTQGALSDTGAAGKGNTIKTNTVPMDKVIHKSSSLRPIGQRYCSNDELQNRKNSDWRDKEAQWKLPKRWLLYHLIAYSAFSMTE